MDDLSDMPIAEYSEYVGDFLRSFNTLAMALGGMELVEQIKSEINFRLFSGAGVEEAISVVYEDYKKRYGIN